MRKVKKGSGNFIKIYVPELKQIVDGDEKTWLIMAQLEYWFQKYPDGFYKFTNPPKEDNPAYNEGDSWSEEMGFSKDKVNNALAPICTHYKSFSAYKNQEGDKFKGNLYCSYYHKPSHKMFYLRNHDKTNEALASHSMEEYSTIFREKHSLKVEKEPYSASGYLNNESPVDVDNTSPEIIDADVVYTENKTKNTTYITQREEEVSPPCIQTLVKVRGVNEQEKSPSTDYVKTNSYDSYSNSSNAAARAAGGGKQPFPAIFELDEEMIGWAKDKNPGIDVHKATEKFKNHNKNNWKNDWLAAWQNWIIDENPPKGTGFNQTDVYRELLADYGTDYKTQSTYQDIYNIYERNDSEKTDASSPFLKKPSPEAKLSEIQSPIAKELMTITYQVEPYMIHRDVFYSELDHLTKEEIDSGLDFICEKEGLGRFLDYYYNNWEFQINYDWKKLTRKEYEKIKQEFFDSQSEKIEKINKFVIDNVLVHCDLLLTEIPTLEENKLSSLLRILINKKQLLHAKNYLYNNELYESSSEYKNKVDEKLKELGL